MPSYSSAGTATAIAANTTKYLGQIKAPSTSHIWVRGVVVGFNGAITTDPQPIVTIERSSTDGTASNTITAFEHDTEDASAAATVKDTFSADPTAVAGSAIVLPQHPQGNFAIRFHNAIRLRAGERLSVKANNPAGASSVTAYPMFEWSE